LFGMINRVCYDAIRQQQLRAGGAPGAGKPLPAVVPVVPRIPVVGSGGRPTMSGGITASSIRGSHDVGGEFIHLRRADSLVGGGSDDNIAPLVRGESVLGRPVEQMTGLTGTRDDGKLLVVESKDLRINASTPSLPSVEMNASGYVIISQADIYTHVFLPTIKVFIMLHGITITTAH
jgi:hypothetical protein